MKYFQDDTIFDPRNINTSNLQDDMDLYESVYRWYSHIALMNNDKIAEKRAIMSFAISETLKAVLSLSIDGEQRVYESILNNLVPLQTETKIINYEFISQ